MKEKDFIEQLKSENTDFSNKRMAINLANSLESFSSDIFTGYIRFLFELIQNADDAEATEISIFLKDDYLIVSHNGIKFDIKDVEAICCIGNGTKKTNENKTGYKGIGFKSVFGKSNDVSIFSNGFQFRFAHTYKHPKYPEANMPWQIIPQWVEFLEFPSSISTYLNAKNYNVSTVIKLKETITLKKDVSELLENGEVLLFLRNVLNIAIYGDLELSIEKTETKSTDAFRVLSLKKNDVPISNWIVCLFEGIQIEESVKAEIQNDEKAPAKLQNREFAEISFAAKVENGKIIPLSGNNSLVYTFLPTKVTSFQFPFLINSSFLTSANREDIHDDRIWNQWLFETAAIKLIDWLAALAQTAEFKMQILQLLPEKTNLDNKLSNSFFSSFYNYGLTKEFVPNKNGNLKRAPEVVIDKTGLSNETFISAETLVSFINDSINSSLLPDAIVHPKLLCKSKLKTLESKFFKLENLVDFFTSDIFINNHSPEQNHLLIDFFYRESENKPNEWLEKLKYVPFIIAQNKTLRPPNKICFPSKVELSELEKDIKVIHAKVYENIEHKQNVIEWLKKIGVSEVSEIKWLENEILPNIDKLKYEEDYLNITNSIYKLHKNGLLEKRHYSELNIMKLLCIDDFFYKANSCYLSDYYLPELKLQQLYDNGHYVSAAYCTSLNINKTDFKGFLKCINVSEDVSFVTHDEDLSWGGAVDYNYRKYIDNEYNDHSSNWEYHGGGALSQSHAFRGFKTISLLNHTNISIDFSKLFWNYILEKYPEKDQLLEDIILLHGYTRNYQTPVVNYFKWFVENEECIPTTINKLCNGKDVFVNEKEIKTICGNELPVIDVEKTINNFWIEVFSLRTEIRLDEYLQILRSISVEKEILKTNFNRIGLIYKKLLVKVAMLTKEEKNIIYEWSIINRLLCANGQFEKARDIKWINIDGFSNTSEHLKLLFIPENLEANANEFKELLGLFGVQIIDSFIPDIKNKEPNATLKIQLQVILPFFTAILERKHYLDYSVEFIRLSKILDNTEFYNASEIVLSFKNQDEIILGPSLYAYLADSELSFKGKWTSPVTLYALIPELLKLFNISDLNEELKLLLQLNESEIEEWSIEQGYDVNAIKERPEYEVSIEKVKLFKDEKSIEQTTETIDISIINEFNSLNKLLKSKNISVEQLMQLISNLDADEIDENISISSKEHLDQKGKNEENRVARELVYQRLISEGFEFTDGMGENSVVNGVCKDNIEYPLVVKGYRNTSYKFNIRPNEWIQLSKPNAMFWVHRGNGNLEVLNLEGLLRANSEFHVQFETTAFSFDGLVKFAEVFRFVKNVHFQLDAPNFSIAKAFEEYKFDKRENGMIEKGSDNQELLH